MDTLESVWEGTVKIIKRLQNLLYERLKEMGLPCLRGGDLEGWGGTRRK